MKLFIQAYQDKFISNLITLSIPNMPIASYPSIDNQLYKIHYMYKFDCYMFISSLWNNEIHQFVSEFYNDVKIIIYHTDNKLYPLATSLDPKISHISYESNPTYKHIPVLVNDQLFFNKHSKNRINATACFLNNNSITISKRLSKVLYPNSTQKIHCFSNVLSHPQNLGPVTEQDKADILNTYSNYLCLDNDYKAEAFACGANLVGLDNEGNIYNIKDNITAQTYQNFLYELLA